ncbi:LysR family transcriptional regulator [Roseomonas marmotae]|uniref:LysR family transcriptional regulator n=1 Tax=Roseomonas marmotae TaxID=2768161 RepID=A0ABS3KB14_9PROT|nr:LysR family transcriptional regulator [Roseomonas marmotae]MBO1074648.1 LysR family transcriptional regulator [Roseomonas marmotae]QTI81668.1 LysR family transcriptional regulator [Roseomonas marmotae]
MENLKALRSFVLVVQAGSLSSAGRQIGLSPASISRYINALEDEVGSRLLNRSSRKLSLTEAGMIYYRYAERILSQLEEASSTISQLQRSPRGVLRVHSRQLIGVQRIIPAMPEFLTRYPDIKVDFTMSNAAVDIVEHNVDVDIRIGRMEDSALIARKLLHGERVLCASPAYLRRAGPITAPGELVAHNCLTYRLNDGSTTWRFMDPQGAVTEVPVEGSYQSDSGPSLRSMALAGLGVIMMPDWSISEDLASGALVPLLTQFRVSYGTFDYGVYAVYQKNRHMSAKVRLFVDFLTELLRGDRAAAA